MKPRAWGVLALFCLLALAVTSGTARAAVGVSSSMSASGGSDLASQAAGLLGTRNSDPRSPAATGGDRRWQVRSVSAEDGELVVCLEVSGEALAQDGWLGMEAVQEEVRRPLMGLTWQSLSVQAWDPANGRCRPLSDFAPRERVEPEDAMAAEAIRQLVASDSRAIDLASAASYPASLAGKTVYVSAGHGWYWTGSQWRTQRPVYQGIIEDHNNAEAVTQFLIPYLENAGATVVPVRERDWATQAAIADNDYGPPVFTKTGVWFTGGSGSGYAGGTYQYAISTAGSPSAIATWTLQVAEPGEYAVYAWVYPGSNRVADAHYTVNHAGGSSLVVLDQRVFPNTWRYLGTFPFHTGAATVSLDNRTMSGGSYAVIADAVRLGGGTFGTFDGISARTTLPINPDNPTPIPSIAPMKPWWEASAFYWSQWSGLDPYDWSYYNDVVARPIFARWHQRSNPGDAVYVSWHTNGYNGDNTTVRGTVTYVHNGDTYPRTDGSLALQAAVHDELIRDIRAGWDSGWTDRGKGQLNLGELRMLWDPAVATARIPGVLLEIAYHDNYEDALALKDPSFNRLAARAVYQGIVAYFEALDGRDLTLLPEPPTHLRVLNAGGGALDVTWSPSLTDGQGLRGDPATGYHVYTSPDGLAWGPAQLVATTHTTLAGLTLGEIVYVKVTAINNGGESFPSETLGARVGEPRLLIVSGFDKLNRFGLVYEYDPVEHGNLRMWLDQMNSQDYVVHHGEAVPTEMAWDSAGNEAVAAGSVALASYDVVDWLLGEETTSVDGTLNAAERAVLSAYLGLHRGLLISGSELGWELVEQGSAPAFLREVLHTEYVADDAGTYNVRPTYDGVFAGLGDLGFDAPGEYSVDYPDIYAPRDGAAIAMRYVGGEGDGQGAAVQYANGCQRIINLGFPFETLREDMRLAVMAKALAFLGACVQADTMIDLPQDGAAYTAMATATGRAVGVNLTAVWLQLAWDNGGVAQDEVYWAGASWTPSAVWFPALGTTAWSYALPALDEGLYRLRAYVEGQEVDPTPAQAVFAIDRTAPLRPTILAPTNGMTVTGPAIDLVWTVPDDSGSAVYFEVDIDGRLISTGGCPYRVTPSLGPGLHWWRLRAVDAAGNASAWSDWAYFSVEVERVFLPVALHH